MNIISAIVEAFRSGGVWMWVILVTQVFSLAIIAERIAALYVRRKPNQEQIAKTFEEGISKGDIGRIIDRVTSPGPHQPIETAIAAGAQAAVNMGGKDEINARMEESIMKEYSSLEKNTGFLAMFGNVGTLMGLLGTIVGLIESFSSVAEMDPIDKAARLSHGIATAMHCTAYGLIMAIPSLVMYAVLTNRANLLADDLNHAATSVYNWLTYNYEGVPTRRAQARG